MTLATSSFSSYWRQRISVCHRRGTARAVQRCLLKNCLARLGGTPADFSDFVNPHLFSCYVFVLLFSSLLPLFPSSFLLFFLCPCLFFFISLFHILHTTFPFFSLFFSFPTSRTSFLLLPHLQSLFLSNIYTMIFLNPFMPGQSNFVQ